MISRGHPKHHPESDTSLIYPHRCRSVSQERGAASRVTSRHRGWVCPRADGLPDRPSDWNLLWSNLANLSASLCSSRKSHTRSAPPVFSSIFTPTTHHSVDDHLGRCVFHAPDRCFSSMCLSRSISPHLPSHLRYHSQSDRPPSMLYEHAHSGCVHPRPICWRELGIQMSFTDPR